MNTNFSEFDLQPQLVQTIADIGYDVPTPIQSTVIPAMLAGQDVIGQSQTGSQRFPCLACITFKPVSAMCKVWW